MESGARRTHPRPSGRPIRHSRREIQNGIFYIVRSGSAWKLLSHDLPPWRTVYRYFWSWRRDGTWQIIHDTVRTWVRQAADRKLEASGAIMDSQTVRTSGQGGTRGYDGPKKVCRRKRHLLVGTLGLVLLVVITAANVQDREGARTLLTPLGGQFRRLRVIWADGAYAGWLQDWVWGPRKRGQDTAGSRTQAERAAWFFGSTMTLDRGADVRLAGPTSSAESGLRVLARNHGSADSHSNDSADGATAGDMITLQTRSN